jgi:predicted glycoside hydrolase/deacetylase ChbG (UPF0249 family)
LKRNGLPAPTYRRERRDHRDLRHHAFEIVKIARNRLAKQYGTRLKASWAVGSTVGLEPTPLARWYRQVATAFALSRFVGEDLHTVRAAVLM